MSNWTGNQINDWNQRIVEEFRTNGGTVGGSYAGASLLLLTTKGKKSGKARTTPLAYQSEGDRLIVVASYLGAPKHPDWYLNLEAEPQVTVEVGEETFDAIATTITDRAEYEQILKKWPTVSEHQTKTTREIPFVALSRVK
jgi:deazaflavin-dependent oxidoreductase (nitroreductase family)